MEVKMQLLKREIGGESFLIPLGKAVYDSNGMFVLTELGAFLRDRIPGAETVEELVKAVCEEYEVDEARAEADIRRFIEKLQSMGIL